MKNLIFMVGLLAFTGCHRGGSEGPPVAGRTACIRVIRPGENGALNIVPCTVEFSNYQKLTLLGEQEAAIRVVPGTYTVQVHSIDFFNQGTNDMALSSIPLELDMRDGANVTIEVLDNDHRGWLIVKKEPAVKRVP